MTYVYLTNSTAGLNWKENGTEVAFTAMYPAGQELLLSDSVPASSVTYEFTGVTGSDTQHRTSGGSLLRWYSEPLLASCTITSVTAVIRISTSDTDTTAYVKVGHRTEDGTTETYLTPTTSWAVCTKVSPSATNYTLTTAVTSHAVTAGERLFIDVWWSSTHAANNYKLYIDTTGNTKVDVGTPDMAVQAVDLDESWTIDTELLVQRLIEWDVYATLTVDRLIEWDVLTSVGTTRLIEWNVESLLDTLTVQRLIEWNVYALLNVQRTINWNVIGSVFYTLTTIDIVSEHWTQVDSVAQRWTGIDVEVTQP